MSLWFRFIMVALRAAFGRPIGALQESVLRFRVLPNDLDVNLHLNNGRYLTLMDLGRIDLALRAGIWKPARRQGWAPLVGSILVRFRRSLAPFQAYELRTRVLCWDDKWFVFEQRFESRGQLCAVALVRGLFRGRAGNVPPADVLALIGPVPSPPPIPAFVEQWTAADEAAYTAARPAVPATDG